MAVFDLFFCFPLKYNPDIKTTGSLGFFPLWHTFSLSLRHWVGAMQPLLRWPPPILPIRKCVPGHLVAVSATSHRTATPSLTSCYAPSWWNSNWGGVEVSYGSKVGVKGQVPQKLFPSQTCPFDDRTSPLRVYWDST